MTEVRRQKTEEIEVGSRNAALDKLRRAKDGKIVCSHQNRGRLPQPFFDRVSPVADFRFIFI